MPEAGFFHGKTGARLVVVGPINLPVGRLFVEEVITECRKRGATRVDVLAFEFEMGLFPAVLDEAKQKGIDLAPKTIPPEVFDKRAVERGQVRFQDVAYIEVTPRFDKKNPLALAVELTDFSVFYSQGLADAIAADLKEGKSEVVCEAGALIKISKDKQGVITRDVLTKHWTDWVDYWAVDFNYESRKEMIKVPKGAGVNTVQGHLPGQEPSQRELELPAAEFEERWTGAYIFENEWQSFRTRQKRDLELTTAPHVYEKPGRYTIAVKVIDIFGNDTMTLVPVTVGGWFWFLLSASDQRQLLGYRVFLYGGWTLLTLAIAAIAFKDAIRPSTARLARISFRIAATFGASQVIFSALYLSTSYSFFASTGEIAIYVTALALWICITFFDIVGIGIEAGTRLLKLARHGLDAEMGHAIGCENPLLYKVEVDHSNHKGPQVRYGDLVAIETRTNVGSIGMVVNRKQLLGKSWLSVYILTTPTGDVITLDLRGRKLIDDPRSVFAATNKVFRLDPALDLAEQDRTAVEATPLYAYKGTFVGYITRDSNINTISFIILRDRDATNREITEGVILKTTIYGESTPLSGHQRQHSRGTSGRLRQSRLHRRCRA